MFFDNTKNSENLNIMLLMTNTHLEIKLPALNFKHQPKYVKLDQRRFNPTVQLFIKMLERHNKETQKFTIEVSVRWMLQYR